MRFQSICTMMCAQLKPDVVLAVALPGTKNGMGAIMTLLALLLGDVTSMSAVARVSVTM